MKPPLLITYLSLLAMTAFAQRNSSSDPYEQRYEWRIRQEILYDVYIPKDANDAIKELYRLTDAKSRAKFKLLNEDTAAVKLFFSLGRWISFNWGFFEGSRLSVYTRELGVYDPDDMSRFYIILFNRSLNRKELDIETLVKSIQLKADERKKHRNPETGASPKKSDQQPKKNFPR